MLPLDNYVKAGLTDPIMFYRLPLIGSLYKRRVELCLAQLTGGDRVLEVGFGSGVTFLNLARKYKEIHGLDSNADAEKVSKAFEKLDVRTFLRKGNALNMPYLDDYFDSVLLISVLEHLKPDLLGRVFKEIRRVIKKNGQLIYGVPVDRPLMKFFFRLLGYDINRLHFSTQTQIHASAQALLKKTGIVKMRPFPFGTIYEIGHFIKI